jgi:hypothetical protein
MPIEPAPPTIPIDFTDEKFDMAMKFLELYKCFNISMASDYETDFSLKFNDKSKNVLAQIINNCDQLYEMSLKQQEEQRLQQQQQKQQYERQQQKAAQIDNNALIIIEEEIIEEMEDTSALDAYYEKENKEYSEYRELSQRLLTEADLRGYSKAELRILRNAIYAMHGRKFTSKDLQDFFGRKSWYNPQYDNVHNKLSDIEKKNVAFIQKHE